MATKQSGKLASRYAKALLSATQEIIAASGATETPLETARALGEFVQVWKNNPTFSFHIISPMFEREQRLNALLAIATAANLNEVAKRFLTVVFERDRITALPDIVQVYQELAEKQAGIIRIQVNTASSVEEDERAAIEERLKAKIPGSLIFDWNVDLNLLGGLVISYEGKILDTSLNTRLNQLVEELQE